MEISKHHQKQEQNWKYNIVCEYSLSFMCTLFIQAHGVIIEFIYLRLSFMGGGVQCIGAGSPSIRVQCYSHGNQYIDF